MLDTVQLCFSGDVFISPLTLLKGVFIMSKILYGWLLSLSAEKTSFNTLSLISVSLWKSWLTVFHGSLKIQSILRAAPCFTRVSYTLQDPSSALFHMVLNHLLSSHFSSTTSFSMITVLGFVCLHPCFLFLSNSNPWMELLSSISFSYFGISSFWMACPCLYAVLSILFSL